MSSTRAALAAVGRTSSIEITMAFPTPGIDDRKHAARLIVARMLDRVLARPATFTQNRRAGQYRLIATAEPGRAAATVLDLRTRIATLADGSDESRAVFVSARHASVSSFVSAPRSSAQWNRVIENAIVNGVDLASLQALPDRLSAVTYADAQAVIAAELAPEHEVLLLEGPKDAVNAAYAELGERPTWVELP